MYKTTLAFMFYYFMYTLHITNNVKIKKYFPKICNIKKKINIDSLIRSGYLHMLRYIENTILSIS